MTEKTCKKVRLIYGCALSVITLILGAFLIWQTLEIYLSGRTGPFSGGGAFTQGEVELRLFYVVSPAFWIWLVMAVVGFILFEIFTVSPQKTKPDVCYTLARLKKRLNYTVAENLQTSLNTVKREQLILKILRICCGALCAAAAVYAIVYLCIPSNFPAAENKTIPIFDMIKRVTPFVAAAFAVCCGVAVYESISAKKQLREVNKLLSAQRAAKAEGVPVTQTQSITLYNKLYNKFSFIIHSKYFLLAMRITVGCLCAVFIILGIFNGSMRDMLVKAIKICTECIGLG